MIWVSRIGRPDNIASSCSNIPDCGNANLTVGNSLSQLLDGLPGSAVHRNILQIAGIVNRYSGPASEAICGTRTTSANQSIVR